MSVQIVSRALPGIGVCHDIGLQDGRRVGVVARRNGVRDIVLYDEDGDGALGSVSLTGVEAEAVARILDGSAGAAPAAAPGSG